MEKSINIDSFDLKILQELQRDGSLSNQALAERVGLTAAPCSRRIKHLEECGVITDRVVRINGRALGLTLYAILHISMDKHIPERFSEFERVIQTFPEVMECYLITGHDADYQLKVAVPDMDRYHDILLGKITTIKGVSGVKSSFIMRKIVDSTAVPLKYYDPLG
ncbi:MAG: Lrp/AsnC family transcriptional regulator [Pseudomonadales bacterium]